MTNEAVITIDAEPDGIFPGGWVRLKVVGRWEPDGEPFVLDYRWVRLPRPGDDLPEQEVA